VKPNAAPTAVVESSAASFPIVGIGYSAGGLEALEKFPRWRFGPVSRSGALT
jgi:chemotaxis response regulator CheB